MRRKFRNFNTRIGEDKKSIREIKRKEKEREEESRNNFKEIVKLNSKINFKSNSFTINQEGLTNFFLPVTFETNKIHIIRGNNGQGKSTLLNDVTNSLFINTMDSLKENRFKISSTNKKVADLLNPGLYLSPYTRDDDGLFPSQIKYDLVNKDNILTMYTDFSTSFFTESSGNIFSDINETYYRQSNGERKIKAINMMLSHLKLILELSDDDFKKGLNLVIVMDEPESGLSLEIQEEFTKKLNRYLNKVKKYTKLSLTFLISSHSFIWDKSHKNILIHNINDFKNMEDNKKVHTKVFI